MELPAEDIVFNGRVGKECFGYVILAKLEDVCFVEFIF